jgi:hypothetical protein
LKFNYNDTPVLTLNTSGAATLSGALTAASASLTTPLTVVNGGTGVNTFTAGRILFGNGTSAVNTSANLFWDNTNSFLGVGVTPGHSIHASGNMKANGNYIYIGNGGAALYGDANNFAFVFPSGGSLYMAPIGTDGTRVSSSDGTLRVGGPTQTNANIILQGNGSVNIGGTSLTSSSKFEITSTTKGTIPAPKMTTTQRNAISSPTAGLQIFNTTTNTLQSYNGSAWGEVGRVQNGTLSVNGMAAGATTDTTVVVNAGVLKKVVMPTGQIKVAKTANESVTSSATLQDDDHLTFSMAANTNYNITMKIFYTATASPDFKWGLTGGSSPTAVITEWQYRNGANGTSYKAYGKITSYPTNEALTGDDTDETAYLVIECNVQNVNAGTFKFQFAQGTSHGESVTVKKGSYLVYSTY